MDNTTPPISGMKKVPYGLPLMSEAWISCCLWALSEENIKKSFKEDTGFNVDNLTSRTPFETLIDQSTGYERDVIITWLDWVTENVWGVEGVISEEDDVI